MRGERRRRRGMWVVVSAFHSFCLCPFVDTKKTGREEGEQRKGDKDGRRGKEKGKQNERKADNGTKAEKPVRLAVGKQDGGGGGGGKGGK